MPLGAVPFPFGICRICKDKATGLHYWVATCEGCKGFFKRSISKYETFKCFFGDSCDINNKTRSQCKACRFKRCLETGMSIDGVRMGRIPKVEKDKVLEAFHEGGSHYSNHELVVKQTDGGNFKFDLNKTIVSTKTTFTSSNELAQSSTAAGSVTTGSGVISVQEICKNDTNKTNVVQSGSHTDVREIGNVKEGLKEQTDTSNRVSTEPPHMDVLLENLSNALTAESLDTPVSFKKESNKDHGQYFPEGQLSTSRLFDEIQSEKCENPFNDKYQSMTNVLNIGQKQVNSKVSQRFSTQHRSIETMSKSFNTFTSQENESTFNSFKSTTAAHDNESAEMINQRPDVTRPFLNETSCQIEDKIRRVPSVYEDTFMPGTSKSEFESTHTTPASDQRDVEHSKDESIKRQTFSPTMINVLLEQVLDSEESVSVITERLQQKHQQGNLSQHVVQNLSQRISEFSAAKKRRKFSEDSPSGSCPQNRKREWLEKDIGNDEPIPYDLSAPHHDCNYHHHHHHPYHQGNHSHVHCQQIHSDDTRMCCSSTLAAKIPKYGDVSGKESASTPVRQATVSSSSISMEEEVKLQKIRDTLDGINIAMKILNRVKAEHREKIHQFKLGKIYIRVMTDSEEDVKETYTKLISGIPNLNERILGFCNSIPGVSDIPKEDQDVLMKRAYYDIWMLSSSEYFQDNESYIIMETGEIYSQQTMRKILNDDIVNKLFEFANQFNSLQLTDMEIAILCATRLTSTDGLELKDRTKVNNLHSHMLDVLAAEVKQNHEIDNARKLIDIFRLLPLLETINRIQREIISQFSVKGQS